MSADRTLAEVVAEGRRLIAEATPGPLKKWGKPDPAQAIEANGRFVATTVGGNDVANADIFVFAVNHLAALLDVAEATAAYQEEMAALGNGVDPALSAALAALALGPDDEGKEKSNG